MLLDIVNKDDGHSPVIVLGSPRSTHHLKHIRNWIIYVALKFAVKELCALDNDEVCREVDSPRQSASGY